MIPRKPRHNLELLRDLAAELRQAQHRLDLAVLDSLALDTPWRAIAAAIGVPHSSLARRYRTPGSVRARWSTSAPRASEKPAAGDTP